MKKLYVVTITTEVVVAAESLEDAKKVVRLGVDDQPEFAVQPMRYLPGAWERESIVYGNRGAVEQDRTVGDWIALGAAPEYTP